MILPEWKIRQEIYHRLNTEHDDDMKNFDIEVTENVVQDAVRYFKNRDIGWIYPSKSYMVGICYARWLAEEFGGRPLNYLDDPELLFNNDEFFKHYSSDPKTYIQILEQIGGWDFDEEQGLVPDVRHYFNLEFGIE